jgi:maltose alpha-D-glucosyltransferase/alpha-amylase
MAIAQEDRFPITDILRQTPDIPPNCQWALFLRNHDELTLEMVTDVERDYLWSTYATDPRARLNLGIRRRLAPLMDNDRRKMELMNSLLFSLPGTPIIYYGDEIGMGDNIYLGDRNGVRTPMQWTPDRNGGFSRCDPARLYAPLIMDPVYGYESVNVEAQSRSLSSLLSWMKRMIVVRKSSKVFGYGTLTFIRPSNRAVLVYVREYHDEVLLCVANLSRSAQAAEIDLSPWRGRVPIEMIGRSEFPPIRDQPYVLTLAPYGFLWLRLCENANPRVDAPTLVPEFETVVVTAGKPLLASHRARMIFERDVLPAFLARCRWFPGKEAAQVSARLKGTVALGDHGTALELAFVEGKGGRERAEYVLPVGVKWKRFSEERENPKALAAARQGAREGTLVDMATDERFIAMLLEMMGRGESIESDGRTLEFAPGINFPPGPIALGGAVRAIDTEQSNTTALVGNRFVVKLFRRVEPGINPEVEVGRFLTDIAAFPNAPALLGSAELVEGDARSALAVVHAFVENQGEAWTVTSAFLDRFVDEQRLLATDDAAQSDELQAYQRLMALIARRLGQMQLALASRDDIEAFRPEPMQPEDASAWVHSVMQRAERVHDSLGQRRHKLAEADRTLADQVLARAPELERRLGALLPDPPDGRKIRHHGDFHLGQILIAKDDAYIIDFEGEPRRSMGDRRRKAPPARDVAGLVRSIDYSATAALGRALKSAPDEGRIARALDVWRERSAETFIAAYRETMLDRMLWPSKREDADGVLDFFLIEKVYYEIEYELSYRPDWLRVPLAGLVRLLTSRESGG